MKIPAIQWTCEICGELRPDALISVKTHDLSAEYGMEVKRHINYCNDNATCEAGAINLKTKCTLFIPNLDTGEKCLLCDKTKPEH